MIRFRTPCFKRERVVTLCTYRFVCYGLNHLVSVRPTEGEWAGWGSYFLFTVYYKATAAGGGALRARLPLRAPLYPFR